MGRSQLDFIHGRGNILNYRDGSSIPGIDIPFLYFGAPGTAFAWHLEEYLLPAASHLLDGASKLWYIVPPDCIRRFEAACKGMLTA